MVPVGHDATGSTVVDLRDEWVPDILSETVDLPQSYRRTFVALANQQIGTGSQWDAARRDRYFELFGIFPSISVVSRRLLDEERHVCHSSIDDGALRDLKRTVAPWTVPAAAARAGVREAVKVSQRHLMCEGLLDSRSREGAFDAGTQDGLRLYQRRHMLPSAGILDEETRETLLTNSRELDFRTLLRVLRERVVDATGLIEDGSALNAWQPILGRYIESSEYRRTLRSAPLAAGAPDLIDPATEAVAVALSWTSPEAAARALGEAPIERVAVRLPPLPAYYQRPMRLRAEIDRGDVWTSYPFDAEGRPRRSPVKNRPTFILYAQTDTGEVPLVRWPTTIGGWKEEKEDSQQTLRYKGSPIGRRYWRDLVAAPAWFPPPTTPDRELVRRRPDGRWAADDEAVGPGYRSAYGLVALFHHRLVGREESGSGVTLSGGPVPVESLGTRRQYFPLRRHRDPDARLRQLPIDLAWLESRLSPVVQPLGDPPGVIHPRPHELRATRADGRAIRSGDRVEGSGPEAPCRVPWLSLRAGAADSDRRPARTGGGFEGCANHPRRPRPSGLRRRRHHQRPPGHRKPEPAIDGVQAVRAMSLRTKYLRRRGGGDRARSLERRLLMFDVPAATGARRLASTALAMCETSPWAGPSLERPSRP
jgi:hypothetical protein